MPTLDSLPAEQRAILELVVKQSKNYAEISGLLGIPEDRVGAQARDSLTALAPRSAERVDTDWRDQVADYLLGQQSGSAAGATCAHLASSEAARTWALSVADSLGDLYPEGASPEIPDGRPEPRRTRRATAGHPAAPAKQAAPRRPRPAMPPDEARTLRRRILAALAVTLVIGVTAFVIGPGFDQPDTVPADSVAGSAASGAGEAADVLPTGLLDLKAEPGEEGKGLATFLTQEGQPGLLVQAKLPPNAEGEAYEVWLYNDQDDAISLGAQVTDDKGNYVGTGPLPTDFGDYTYIDLSREPINDDPAHAGDSVLRGRIADAQSATGGAGAPPPPGAGAGTEPPAP